MFACEKKNVLKNNKFVFFGSDELEKIAPVLLKCLE